MADRAEPAESFCASEDGVGACQAVAEFVQQCVGNCWIGTIKLGITINLSIVPSRARYHPPRCKTF